MRRGYAVVHALTILVVISIFVVVVLVASSNVIRISTLGVERQMDVSQRSRLAPTNLLMLSVDYYIASKPSLTSGEMDEACKGFLDGFTRFLQGKEDGQYWIELVERAKSLQRWAKLSDDFANLIVELRRKGFFPDDVAVESYVFAIDEDKLMFVAKVGGKFSYATFMEAADRSYVYRTSLYTPAPVRLSGESGGETINFYGPLTLPSTSVEMLTLAGAQFHGPVRVNGTIKAYNCSSVEFYDSVEFGDGGPVTLRLSNTTYHGTLTVHGDFVCEWATMARFYGAVYVSRNMEFVGNQINVVYFYKPVHVAGTLRVEYYIPTLSFNEVAYLTRQPELPPGGSNFFKKGYEIGAVSIPAVESVPNVFDGFSPSDYMNDIESQTSPIEQVMQSGAAGSTGLKIEGNLTVSYNYDYPEMRVRMIDASGREYLMTYVPSGSPPYDATLRCGSKVRDFSFNGVIMAGGDVEIVPHPGVDTNVLEGSLGIFSGSSISVKAKLAYEFLKNTEDPAGWRDVAMQTDDNTVLSLTAMGDVTIADGVNLVMAVMHSFEGSVQPDNTSIFGAIVQRSPLDLTGKSITFVHDPRLVRGETQIIGGLDGSNKGQILDLR